MTLCARGGCTGVAKKRHTYCSKRCHALERLRAGWRPQDVILRPDVRARAMAGASRFLLAENERRRRERRHEVIARLEKQIPEWLSIALDRREMAAVRRLMFLGYDVGRGDGYQAGFYERKKASAA